MSLFMDYTKTPTGSNAGGTRTFSCFCMYEVTRAAVRHAKVLYSSTVQVKTTAEQFPPCAGVSTAGLVLTTDVTHTINRDKVEHTGQKYKERFVLILKLNISLYCRPEWYVSFKTIRGITRTWFGTRHTHAQQWPSYIALVPERQWKGNDPSAKIVLSASCSRILSPASGLDACT